MYQLTFTRPPASPEYECPTAVLTEGGYQRWMASGMWAAQYRVLVKRRLRRECRACGCPVFRVLDPLGGLVEQGLDTVGAKR